ncbi:MAG: META domain-containing protein [Flammeovirgaceae bacterium]|nr:META domain-containing protein [Flammeovirgaceae bacterium]
MNFLKSASIIVPLFALLSSCKSGEKVSNNSKKMTSLKSTSWELYAFEDGKAITYPDEKKVTLVFDENGKKVSGFAGCNRFFGTAKTERETISFGPMGATKMMCAEPAMGIEDKFLSMVEQTSAFEIKGDQLLLKSEEGVILTYNKGE